MAGLVILRSYYDPTEAIVARSVLEQHGYFVAIPELNHYSVLPMYLFALGGIHLMVHADDVEDSLAILNCADDDGYEECPACAARRYVRYAQPIALVLLIFPIIPPVQFLNWRKCIECDHKWRARKLSTLHFFGSGLIFVLLTTYFVSEIF